MVELGRCSIFNNLGLRNCGTPDAFSKGMTLSIILLASQVLVTIFALVRESREDARFEGDKLLYRS